MKDQKLERLFDNLAIALDEIYDYICETRDKSSDNSAKMIFDWHEYAVKDYAMIAIQAYEQEQLKLELKKVLNQLNGILDDAYENQETDSDKEYINEVENKLHEILKKKGMI